MATAETPTLRATQSTAPAAGATSGARHRDRKALDRRGPWRWPSTEPLVEELHIDQRVLDLCG
jgi:hypothetical protein